MNANKPYIIGLTGGIGAGKSEAASFLESLGAAHIDADKISRELTAGTRKNAALSAIEAAFGPEVFRGDGSLDRAALAKIVFDDKALRRKLEAILHPLIQRRIMDEIDLAAKEEKKVVVLNVPLLFETGMDALCDETWVLNANEETQIARVMMRDGIGREQALLRIQSQIPAQERNARATEVLSTDRPVEKTHAELAGLYQSVLKRL